MCTFNYSIIVFFSILYWSVLYNYNCNKLKIYFYVYRNKEEVNIEPSTEELNGKKNRYSSTKSNFFFHYMLPSDEVDVKGTFFF